MYLLELGTNIMIGHSKEVYMKCMFCLQLQNDIELYFYTKRQLTKYCEEKNEKFYFDYTDDETKVKYYKVVI